MRGPGGRWRWCRRVLVLAAALLLLSLSRGPGTCVVWPTKMWHQHCQEWFWLGRRE